MRQIEQQWFRKALRLNNRGPKGQKGIKVYLQNDKKPTLIYQHYTLSRDLFKGRR